MLVSLKTGFMQRLPSLIASLGSIVQQLLQALMDAAPQMLNAASQLIGQMATAFSENWPSILQSIVSVLGKLVLTVLQNAPKLLAAGLKLVVAIGQGLTKGVGTILSAAGGLLKSLLNKILSGGKSLLSAGGKLIGNLASGVRNAATNVWNAAKAVAEKLLSPITAVKEKIKGIIDKIKGFFKFKVTMPHIPVPHFGINPSGWKVKDLLHGSIPSLSVKWYAKGGVFDGPSVVGVGEARSGGGCTTERAVGKVRCDGGLHRERSRNAAGCREFRRLWRRHPSGCVPVPERA